MWGFNLTIQILFKEKKNALCAEGTGKGEPFKVKWIDKKIMKAFFFLQHPRFLPHSLK